MIIAARAHSRVTGQVDFQLRKTIVEVKRQQPSWGVKRLSQWLMPAQFLPAKALARQRGYNAVTNFHL
jgi:hypothetical protein